MSTSEWLFEVESGRYYVPWQDEYGTAIRRYDDGVFPLPSSINQAPSTQEYQATPRSEFSQRRKPRSTASSHNGSSSGRRSATARERRESESVSKDTQEYDERRDSKTISTAPSSLNYHGSWGDNLARDGEARNFEAAPARYTSTSYGGWQSRSTEPGLTSEMSALSISEAGGKIQSTPFNQDAGVASGAYVDHRSQFQWPSINSPSVTGFAGSHQAKGKDIATIQPSAPKDHVAGTGGDRETLDKSYQVRNHDWKTWFRTGRVFSTLWTDPWAGPDEGSEDSQFMSSVTIVQYGEKVHSKIRRFVVVRQGDRCCVCLPVTTYAGRGHMRFGLKLEEHGLIYSSVKSPKPIDGIKKQPLKVRLSSGAAKLLNPSYVNYGRPYTVETNVKVKDVGELDSDSRRLLRKYYNEVNIAPDDNDCPGTGIPRTAEDRAADLTGMGGAVIDTAGSYTGAHPPAFGFSGHSAGPPDTYQSSSHVQHRSARTGNSGYGSAGQIPFVADAGYSSLTGPSPQVVSSSINYSNSPVYDMNYPSASDRYINSVFAEAGGGSNISCPDSRYSSTPVASSSTWPTEGSSPAHQDSIYTEDEVLVLPTLEEAEASRNSRRHRDRDRNQDRARERDLEYGRRDRDRHRERR